MVLDFDEDGHLVGSDIDRASEVVNLTHLEAESLPVASVSFTQRAAEGRTPYKTARKQANG